MGYERRSLHLRFTYPSPAQSCSSQSEIGAARLTCTNSDLCDGIGCLDGFRGGISERLVAGCWFPLSPKSNSSVLSPGAVKLVGSRRPVGKVGETHSVFPGLSIGDCAGAVRKVRVDLVPGSPLAGV